MSIRSNKFKNFHKNRLRGFCRNPKQQTMRRLNFGLKALEAAYLTPAHAKTCKNIVKKFLLKAPRE